MNKDELLQIHIVLVIVRRHLEQNGGRKDAFAEYDALRIAPHHFQRSKLEHEMAVFTLSRNIADSLCSGERSNSRLKEVLGAIADRIARNITSLPERSRVDGRG